MNTRKRWTKQEGEAPELIKAREKRKWQINLRRYVLQKSPCPVYAPYFGLDIKNMRLWFESQFTHNISWEGFGRDWQFEHIIPVTFFDFSKEEDLILCWSFVNLRIEPLAAGKETIHRTDLLAAKTFFTGLFEKTGYETCRALLKKIAEIERNTTPATTAQEAFIKKHRDYLNDIKDYTQFEFELLNSGRSLEAVKKEIEMLQKTGI